VAGIEFRNLRKVFPGGAVAVDDFDLAVEDSEFMVLVGPSGSGKTTVLRIAAGLEDATAGAVLIGGEDVSGVAPMDRNIAMVFQSYALYPHMTVFENMAFGLKLHGEKKAAIAEKVAGAAQMLGLEDLLRRKPSQLSGGQRQRVAMGRAIVREPDAFLMDEPLSNLDAKLRVEMRAYLGALHQRLRTTTLYVTHDQTEAMTMGDRVAVMRDGVLQQVDRPQVLYERPVNRFVAAFIGSPAMNLVRSQLTSEEGAVRVRIGEASIRLPQSALDKRPGLAAYVGTEVILGIRPEDFEDATFVPAANGAALDVDVSLAEPMGAELIVHFPVAASAESDAGSGLLALSSDAAGAYSSMLTARLNPRSGAETGKPLRLAVDAERLHFFDATTEAAVW
jgi:multiple sugar transport system ATP-binding protein